MLISLSECNVRIIPELPPFRQAKSEEYRLKNLSNLSYESCWQEKGISVPKWTKQVSGL